MLKTVSDGFNVSIVAFVFATAAVASIAMAGVLVNEHSRARNSELWPIHQGIVLSVERNDSPVTRIRYVYSVAGYAEFATRQQFLTGLLQASPAVGLKAGDRINVYVDPNDRRIAVLSPGGDDRIFLALLIGCAACVFIGIAGVVWSLDQLARQFPVSGVSSSAT